MDAKVLDISEMQLIGKPAGNFSGLFLRLADFSKLVNYSIPNKFIPAQKENFT